LGKIVISSVAEKGGKINCFLSSQYINEAGIKIPTGGIDNFKIIKSNAGLEHPKDIQL